MASQVVLVVTNPLANAGDVRDTGSILESGRSPGEEMVTRSSILARRSPWRAEPGGLQSLGSQRVRHNWSDLARTHTCYPLAVAHQIPAPFERAVMSNDVIYSTARWKHCKPAYCLCFGTYYSHVPASKSLKKAVFLVVVQSLSRVRFFVTPWTAARQASLSFTISLSLLRLLSIELVMPSKHLILCCPLVPSIFPASGSFSNESVLSIRWPKHWSFRISPSNEYSVLLVPVHKREYPVQAKVLCWKKLSDVADF